MIKETKHLMLVSVISVVIGAIVGALLTLILSPFQFKMEQWTHKNDLTIGLLYDIENIKENYIKRNNINKKDWLEYWNRLTAEDRMIIYKEIDTVGDKNNMDNIIFYNSVANFYLRLSYLVEQDKITKDDIQEIVKLGENAQDKLKGYSEKIKKEDSLLNQLTASSTSPVDNVNLNEVSFSFPIESNTETAGSTPKSIKIDENSFLYNFLYSRFLATQEIDEEGLELKGEGILTK